MSKQTVLSQLLFWNPSCINFKKLMSVVDDFTDRTVTNLQWVCRNHSVIENQCGDVFNDPISHRCGLMPWLFFVSTSFTTSEHSNPLVRAFLWPKENCHDTVLFSLCWISTPLTPSAYWHARQLNKVKYITTTGRFCACGYACTQQWGQSGKKNKRSYNLLASCRLQVDDNNKHNFYLFAPLKISK